MQLSDRNFQNQLNLCFNKAAGTEKKINTILLKSMGKTCQNFSHNFDIR